jgi:CubicO group peptidase (beta-lactamase class C family)
MAALARCIGALLLAMAPAQAEPSVESRIQALVPRLEAQIAAGMAGFDTPGLAIGIVANDRLVYAKGFGARRRGGAPVDTRTVFQVGSTTKAFLATTLAIAVDRAQLAWDDRVVDLDPDFRLKDPWVTREFRVFDLIAQRSGLPPYVNDMLGMIGLDEAALIRSLREVEPVASFRTSFAYTNITHLAAGRLVAQRAGAADWESVLRNAIFAPLGMGESSVSADAIEAAANHARGHRWDGTSIEVPFTPIFPYGFKGAGAINSTVEDMARWLRLQLGDGSFEGKRVVSAENLAVTRMPRVAISDSAAYATGWLIQATPNGTVTWHNGGTLAFGAYVGLQRDRGLGIVILTNQANVGLPDALGAWIFDRLMGNPDIDHVAARLAAAKAKAAADDKAWARPAKPRPAPPLDPLAGSFRHPLIGTAIIKQDGAALLMRLATGAFLRLEPWDGDVFTAMLQPHGRFAALAANGPQPMAFAQFQVDGSGHLNVLRLKLDDGQHYDFVRN